MIKAGENAILPVTLLTTAGAATTYASKALFEAAGWTFHYWLAGVVVASPTWTFVVVDAATGRHEIHLTVSAGSGEAFIKPPAGFMTNVEAFPLDVETFDLDAIGALVSTADSGISGDDRAAITNIEVVEGDAFQRTLTVPAVSLTDFGESTLANVTAVNASARMRINRVDTLADFVMAAAVASAPDRTVYIGCGGFPAGGSVSGFTITAVSTGSKTFTVAGDKRKFFDGITRLLVANSTGNDGEYTLTGMALTGGNTVFTVSESVANATGDGTITDYAESRDFFYDVQLTIPKAWTITAASIAAKTFTFASDQRRFFNVGAPFVVSASTGNNGAYTVASVAYTGGNTIVTVAEVVASNTGDGTLTLTLKLTPLRGTITVLRQEDRT